jgi:hypothetical protein
LQQSIIRVARINARRVRARTGQPARRSFMTNFSARCPGAARRQACDGTGDVPRSDGRIEPYPGAWTRRYENNDALAAPPALRSIRIRRSR